MPSPVFAKYYLFWRMFDLKNRVLGKSFHVQKQCPLYETRTLCKLAYEILIKEKYVIHRTEKPFLDRS